MNLLWLYDLPTWLFGLIVVGAFVGFALGGQVLARRAVRRWLGGDEYNDFVGHFLSASGVFFGITLGLLSVGAWENFAAVDDAVTTEATTIGVLLRTVDAYPEPHRSQLIGDLQKYTRDEIDKSWPLQRAGVSPSAVGADTLTVFYRDLTSFEPVTESQKALHAEAMRQYSNMVESRRGRLSSVLTQLPPIVWLVVFSGSVLNLALMWLFVVQNTALHDLLTGTMAGLLGLLVFLLAIMDFPFRGEFYVGPDAFEKAYSLSETMKR
jgi:hypothetical protein